VPRGFSQFQDCSLRCLPTRSPLPPSPAGIQAKSCPENLAARPMPVDLERSARPSPKRRRSGCSDGRRDAITVPARRINSLPALRSSMRNIKISGPRRVPAARAGSRFGYPPVRAWSLLRPSCFRSPHLAVARFFQKRSILSVPPNRVLNVVESQTSTSPARLPPGGIQTNELNSLLPESLNGCGRVRSIG